MLQRSLTENPNIVNKYREISVLQMISHLENIRKSVFLNNIKTNYKK